MNSHLRLQACAWALALSSGGALAAPDSGSAHATTPATDTATDNTARATAGPVKLPKDRCPTMPVPAIRTSLPDGDHRVNVRFTLKADGSVTQIRAEGRRVSQPFVRAVEEAVGAYQCLPGETDLDITSEFRLVITSR